MSENVAHFLSGLIKFSVIAIVLTLLSLIIYQYSVIGKLNAECLSVKTELANLTKTEQELIDEYEQITENYTTYVEDSAKDNYNMVRSGEIKFNGKKSA